MCYDTAMATNNRNKKQWAGIQKLRAARRTMMYIVRTLLIVTVGGIVCIAAFMTSERMSNLYILSTEGMAMRADCILKNEVSNDLQEYFTMSYLDQDQALGGGAYANYTIASYDYSLEIEKISVLPWSMSASVTAVERVSPKGSINADRLSEGESAANYPLPEWTPVRYKLHFINSGTRWYISELEVVELNPAAAPLNTPDPNMSPVPMATPTPAPTDAPAAS